MVVAGVLYMRVGVGQLSGVKGLLNAITKQFQEEEEAKTLWQRSSTTVHMGMGFMHVNLDPPYGILLLLLTVH